MFKKNGYKIDWVKIMLINGESEFVSYYVFKPDIYLTLNQKVEFELTDLNVTNISVVK